MPSGYYNILSRILQSEFMPVCAAPGFQVQCCSDIPYDGEGIWMENIYQLVAEAEARGERIALATVVRVEGSTPREAGAKMVVYDSGHSVGTVGGGKMEALVIQEARQALCEGTSRLAHYDMLDPEEGDVSICGGAADVFIDVVIPCPTLLVVGAGHVAMPVAEIGHLCGFRVVIVDDRPDLIVEGRFPSADERIAGDIVSTLRAWPITSETYVVIVTRGHAHDEDALRAVIDSKAGYIGMIGSRRKVRTLMDHLRADGIAEELIGRVRSPVGLDIGAETPAEIAVSILAEVIMLRRGGSGSPMKLE
jgi:xanthine dehydrogenase accessory factor